MHLNTPFIQVPLDAMPIFRLAQMGQQMAQAIVTEIQRLDDLGREPAQGMLHALDIDFDCDLPVITFCENMRQPNDRCPSPTQAALFPVARDMPVQDFRQAHHAHLPDEEGHIVDTFRDDHEVTLPKTLLDLRTQLYSHGVLSPVCVALLAEDNHQPPECIALTLWTAEDLGQIQYWDFFYGEWGDLQLRRFRARFGQVTGGLDVLHLDQWHNAAPWGEGAGQSGRRRGHSEPDLEPDRISA